jgi:hypothetical protein
MIPLTTEQKATIATQVALNAKYMVDFLRTRNWAYMSLYDPSTNSFVSPFGIERKWDDFVAAPFFNAVALNAYNGDDYVDQYGHTGESKLIIMDSHALRMNSNGTVIVAGSKDDPIGLGQKYSTKFRKYKGTDPEHHTKDTGVVLLSADHRCYIGGFKMPGKKVKEFVHRESNSNSPERAISLAQFGTYGNVISSDIPHIGWDQYYNALFNFLRARDGWIRGKEADDAFETWLSLAEEKNWQKL